MDRSENRVAPGLKPSAGLLWLSICLNVLLAATATRLCTRTAPATSAPRARPVAVTEHAETTVRTNSPSSAAYVTNGFRWRQIESTNYETYAANLRAAGCPEKTVRDILLADVEKFYGNRRRELLRNERYWLAGNERRLADRARARALEALDKEAADLVWELLGIERHVNRRPREAFEERAFLQFFLGPMPEETFERATAVLNKYESLKDGVNSRARGVLIEEDDAALEQLHAAMKREMASLLTPAQWEEFQARASSARLFDGPDQFAGVEVTPAEARQVALAGTALRDPFQLFHGSDDGVAKEERELARQQFTNTVAGILGAKRFADYERAEDKHFQQLFEFGQENNLPKPTTVKVYEIQKLTEEEVERIRYDAGLDEAGRQRRFEEMEAAIQKEVLGAMGADAYSKYLNGGGHWVTNLNAL